MLQVATVPIAIGIEHPDILGTISVGFLLDDALASQLKAVTGSDIAFGMDGVVLAGTLSRDQWPPLGKLLQASQPQTITLAGEEFSVLARPLSAEAAGRRPVGADRRWCSDREPIRYDSCVKSTPSWPSPPSSACCWRRS